ncbi:helix-turn-helix domain-containing protein [Halopiger goleimassiliensis]|uniref:helix-turn-helix domain-containing protein n=1 Tax=Halopiger goleimassiliensis TaxID=1293048 RepID=UPI000677A000|nr:helix-turn-helix domain-containing protein [Halopiger goleimassiliensis]
MCATKYLRATATVDPDTAPTFLNVLANGERIDEARKVNWNASRDDGETALFAIDGDAEYFGDRVAGTPGIESIALSADERGQRYALVEMRPLETPMADLTDRACSQPGLVIQRPLVYRDGAVYGHVVGDPDRLQAALDGVGDAIDVRIDEIGTGRGDPDRPTTALSERQREAVTAALALGHYDEPRAATHANVADALGCAAATASEHLRKAEAKLIRAGTEGVEFEPQP